MLNSDKLNSDKNHLLTCGVLLTYIACEFEAWSLRVQRLLPASSAAADCASNLSAPLCTSPDLLY
jgi:hypothetical protein